MSATSLPSGTVTFLFTDIEGSTRLWQECPDEMADAVERHEDLVRAAIEEGAGYVFSTAGDAFAAAFATVGDGLLAARSAQRALAAEPWSTPEPIRVRMGLHVGEANERAGDYFGHCVNTAARIMSAGHGGQILCSWEVAELARVGPHAGQLVVHDLGTVRLRDLLEPIHLAQVSSVGDDASFPPLRTVDEIPNNLPVVTSRLIGRAAEIERVAALVTVHRSVTLTGVGGCGKTRLALAVAADVADAHPDGVVFVDLAPVTDEHRVAEAVVDAGGFQIAAPPGHRRIDAIARFVATRRMLVVLDNCEHVLDAAAELVERIMTAGPDATVLATSREALEIDGEHAFRVPPLSTGQDGGDEAAVELLVDRARAADDGFTFSADDRPAARALCRHLDGLPLAIELAAAQLVHVGVADLADRLDRRFEVLVGGRRRRQRRQQTLQAMMDWSWDLLDDDERRLLAMLSVFAGPVGLDGIQTVCGRDLTGDPLPVLRSLVAKSLVEARQGGGTRYRLLETVRMFARGKLDDAGSTEELRMRHRAWLVDRVSSTPFDVQSLSLDWSAAFVEELDEIFAAVDWSIGRGDHDEAAVLIAGGASTWRDGFRCVRAIETCWQLLDHPLRPELRGRVLIAGADAAMAAGDHELMSTWTTAALAEGRALGDPTLHALAAVWAGIPLLLPDPARGRELIAEAHAVAATPLVRSWTEHWMTYAHQERLGEPLAFDHIDEWPADSYARYVAYGALATNDAVGGRLDSARDHVEAMSRVIQRAGRSQATDEIVLVEALAGEPGETLRMAAEARRELERSSELLWRTNLVLAIAVVRLRLGDTEVALRYLERLKSAPMYHPKFYDVRRRCSRQARDAIGDDERIAAIRAAAAELDIDTILDRELGPTR